MPIRLICVDGEAVPSQVTVDGPLEVGRDPHCDIRLLGDPASRYHLRIEPLQSGLRCIDHQSRNGTWVDGRRISQMDLGDGQRLSAGGATWVVISSEALDQRVVADGGLTLHDLAQDDPKPWQGHDDPSELPAIHALTRRLAQCHSQRQRAALVCALCHALLNIDRCAIICQGTLLAGSCSARLAQRLAVGNRSRLMALGKELKGQTIAAESVGSAISVPLGSDLHLVAIRGLDQEALDRQDLARLNRLAAEISPYFNDPDTPDDPFAPLVGSSPIMAQLRRRLQRLSVVDSTVLITGPSGSGKELIAQCLHRASGRRDGPLIAVNCAAVAPSLFEAELFGHEKGAFSGADHARPGRIRAADGGTLFLDEVGELPLELQAKLLRVVQEGEVEPVGSHQPLKVNVRIITATNRDLAQRVAEGQFREDLYYRLDVLRVHSPALSERREDIPALAQAILERLAEQHGRPPPQLNPDAAQALRSQPWPGNVRQLINTLERALVFADTSISADDLDLAHGNPTSRTADDRAGAGGSATPFPSLAQMEARHIADALRHSAGNKSAAARILGISRPTLLRKICEYGLD